MPVPMVETCTLLRGIADTLAEPMYNSISTPS
jgi:hypothetical protein